MGKKPLKKSSADRTKVVHLITLLELGGAQGNTIYTVRHLDDKEYETHLWCGKGAYWDSNVKDDLGKEKRLRYFKNLVRPISPLRDLICIFDLTKALKKSKPKILHTHSSKAGILGRIAGWFAGVPIIIHTFHGFGFNDQQKPWTRFLFILAEKLAAPMAHKLVFVSDTNIDVANHEGIGESSQYVRIRSGVPIQSIEKEGKKKSNIRKALNIANDTPLITTIGAFKPQKNLTAFLEVMSLIASRNPKVQALIVGDGALRTQLELTSRRLNLSEKIHFLGWREDIPAILGESDLFMMTSLWEGLPRALVEALILGIPSVCYDTDGVRDLLSMGGGCLISQGQTQQMAEEALRILQKGGKHLITSELKDKIKTEFDIDGMVAQQESLYRSQLDLL